MNINEKYKIESDELNIVLSELVTVKEFKRKDDTIVPEHTKWVQIAWFSTVQGCYKELVSREIFGSGMKSLEVILKAIKQSDEFIRNHVN